MLSEYQQRQQALENLRKAKEPKVKAPYKGIPKKSAKKIAADKLEKEARGNEDSPLDLWFEEMRQWLNGKCVFCGGRTTWKNEDMWRIAIAHLLPKSKFKSVAMHNDNWTELCWDCHTNFDNKMLSLTDLNCFESVVQKFAILYPLMTREEKRRVPNVLLTYLDAEL